MPQMTFDRVAKSYGDTPVIREFSAQVEDEEFLVLLGPSGCGKSTMLRMIAGLTEVTSGELRFDDRRVNELEPKDRNIAFVFQSYALYPHMTVAQNIAFPLVMKHFRPWHHIPGVNAIMRRVITNRHGITEKVREVAGMLELTDYLDRRPRSLSGGQRQRVAVARSLVRDPDVYLLDEPLSNLDAKLRTQMRAEISALHRRVHKTFIYVTHDQVEAMTMATRIVVLSDGEVQQIGTPEEIYESPRNVFVARFIGSPGMNLLPVAITAGAVGASDGGQAIAMAELPDGEYLLGARPENVRIGARGELPVEATVVTVEQLGGETVLGFTLGDENLGEALTMSGDGTTYFARVASDRSWQSGDRCSVDLAAAPPRYFDPSTGLALEPHAALNQVEGS